MELKLSWRIREVARKRKMSSFSIMGLFLILFIATPVPILGMIGDRIWMTPRALDEINENICVITRQVFEITDEQFRVLGEMATNLDVLEKSYNQHRAMALRGIHVQNRIQVLISQLDTYQNVFDLFRRWAPDAAPHIRIKIDDMDDRFTRLWALIRAFPDTFRATRHKPQVVINPVHWALEEIELNLFMSTRSKDIRHYRNYLRSMIILATTMNQNLPKNRCLTYLGMGSKALTSRHQNLHSATPILIRWDEYTRSCFVSFINGIRGCTLDLGIYEYLATIAKESIKIVARHWARLFEKQEDIEKLRDLSCRWLAFSIVLKHVYEHISMTQTERGSSFDMDEVYRFTPTLTLTLAGLVYQISHDKESDLDDINSMAILIQNVIQMYHEGDTSEQHDKILEILPHLSPEENTYGIGFKDNEAYGECNMFSKVLMAFTLSHQTVLQYGPKKMLKAIERCKERFEQCKEHIWKEMGPGEGSRFWTYEFVSVLLDIPSPSKPEEAHVDKGIESASNRRCQIV